MLRPHRSSSRLFALVKALAALLLAAVPVAAQHAPVIDFESILDTYFDNSGRVSLSEHGLVFAPEAPCLAEVAVTDASGNVLARHAYFEDYRARAGVFGRMMVDGPADITLTTPGVYYLIFLWNSEQITRFPFVLKQTGAGDDPFDPVVTYAFDGLWRQLGHITWTTKGADEVPIPRLTFWAGELDLAEGKTDDMLLAVLSRDGKTVAHSKRRLVQLRDGHFHRTKLELFHPHEKKDEHVATFFTKAELEVDGEYELKLARLSDMQVIRNFRLTVRDGALVPHARSALDHEPRQDLLVPRVGVKGATSFVFEEAVWVESR